MSGNASSTQTSWRGYILKHFSQEIAAVSRLTIVSDPDQLLTEQGVLDGLRSQGFDLIAYDDPIAFRFAYEKNYRQAWDAGCHTNLVVVLHALKDNVEALPFDLLTMARQDHRLLTFSVGELFPQLSPNVLAELDRSDFEVLHDAQRIHQPGALGENATRDFVLHHVFGVVPSLINSIPSLLGILLKRHYRGRKVPEKLKERFLNVIRQAGKFDDWPLDELVTSREAFFEFIQERWPIFVRKYLAEKGRSVAQPTQPYLLKVSGPEILPFDDHDIRVFIDTLFIEGHLKPTHEVSRTAAEGSWVEIGVFGGEKQDRLQRFEKLTDIVRQTVPHASADYLDWLEFVPRWGEWSALLWEHWGQICKEEKADIRKFHEGVEETFSDWMCEHFASLHNLSYWPRPVMVHQIARFLSHGWDLSNQSTESKKIALVVVDGLAWSQWVVLREMLAYGSGIQMVESAAFAWVPTLTSVSRQAIFAGEMPFYFGASIGTTSKEERHWRRFWGDRKANLNQISYICQKKQEDDVSFQDRVKESIQKPQCRVAGIVVGIVDQMMHGTVTGSSGLQAQIRHWSEEGHFRSLVELLLNQEFQVFVTADHGNIEGKGIGKPNVGAIADERGERVHVFPEVVIRDQVKNDYPDAICWPPSGLPENYNALLAPKLGAFIPKGKHTVGHGGISLEEVLVPFVSIVKKI